MKLFFILGALPKKQPLFLFMVLFIFVLGRAQENGLDSLLAASKKQEGKALLETFNEISWRYRHIQVDSALSYAGRALEVAKKTGGQKLHAAAYNSLASAYQAKSLYDSAVVYHTKSLSLSALLKDSIAMANTYNNLGIVEDELGNFESSLEHYFKALKIFEHDSASTGLVAMVFSNIGIVYKKQEEYALVLNYYEKALDIYKSNADAFGTTVTSGNIGAVLLRLKRFDEAIVYANDAAIAYKEMGYLRYVPYMLNNKAVAQDSLGQHKKAEATYNEALVLFEQDKNQYELANTRIGFSKNQLSLGNYDSALQQLRKALTVAREKDFKEFEVNALKILAETYFKKGDGALAYAVSQDYIIKKDSLFQIEKTKNILELEKKYKTEKQGKLLAEQQVILSQNKMEISKKNDIIIGSLSVAFLLGLIGYLLYGQQRSKNKQLQIEAELKTTLVKIETQNRLQEERLRISRDLHDNIGSQLTFIISTIDNVKYGLKSVDVKMNNQLGQLGLFAKNTINDLRDTIWAMNKEAITFEDLQYRINSFITNANTSSDKIDFEFVVDSDIDLSCTFPATEGINLYRIIQEAVTNALKYAFNPSQQLAQTIAVHIYKSDDFFHIEITDNGNGFDLETGGLGNGIDNMRKRAANFGSALEIKSQKKKGTFVTCSIPVRHGEKN